MDEGLALLFDEPKEETLMESFDKKTLNKEDKLPFTRENSQSRSNSTSGNSTGVISVGGLVAAVLGSIIGTAIISFMAGYWVIKRKQFSKNELLIKNDPVNVQVIHG
ncbi:hypothetical protein RhiirA5_409616 [Rhizophagus irregularis]|uniref:Uncharacterized protein n=1 Tax=Rhizophagus irregularis TaxID=588596 RepID=A0A2N0Q588_9GLOM|nr:hypothetical protein RhiirA5_409616 [Rhizophagus irregularis]